MAYLNDGLSSLAWLVAGGVDGAMSNESGLFDWIQSVAGPNG